MDKNYMVCMGACGVFAEWLGAMPCVSDYDLTEAEGTILVEILRMNDQTLEMQISKTIACAEHKKSI